MKNIADQLGNNVALRPLIQAETEEIEQRRETIYLDPSARGEVKSGRDRLAVLAKRMSRIKAEQTRLAALQAKQIEEVKAQQAEVDLHEEGAKPDRRGRFVRFFAGRFTRRRPQALARAMEDRQVADSGVVATTRKLDRLTSVAAKLAANSSRIECKLDLIRQAALTQRLTGLSLSGGGIRSACFNLGLLEQLDQLKYEVPPGSPLKTNQDCNHLELFDYVSSVSGGSYAAGHLATAMLPESPVPPPVPRSRVAHHLGQVGKAIFPGLTVREEPPTRSPEWLGNLVLTSKTVPGWLWGVGVWSLGVAFQLLKTGSLLVGLLALVAFLFRMLDSPDGSRFCDALGFHSDLARGFVPFWFALGIFLVACWINDSRCERWVTVAWLGYSSVVIVGYAGAIWWYHADPPVVAEPLPFWAHYAFWMALPVPVVCVCLGIVTVQGVKSLWGGLFGVRSTRPSELRQVHDQTGLDSLGISLRTERLLPILVALFCIAGLVTTGDIDLNPPTHSSTQLLKAQEQSRDLAAKQNWIANAALSALGVTSLAFFFPRNLFKSARRIEDHAAGINNVSRVRGRGWEPIFRVIVFLCSYGFILLVIFVLYGTVARENVSGYYEWREDLPLAAFHRTEFRDPDQAWERIARDAADPKSSWGKFAARLLRVRNKAGLAIERERVVATEVRALESMPWTVRLVPFLKNLGPSFPWLHDGFRLDPAAARLYEAKRQVEVIQEQLTQRIATEVLGNRSLYLDLPAFEDAPPPGTVEKMEPADYRALWDKYHEKAKSLATLPGREPAIQAATRNNNRRALQLYLPDLMRDRVHEKVIFASIVWPQDQWTRFHVILVAGGLWLLCCAVDVNSFSLQKFYRGHVIDSWVRIPPGTHVKRWLYQTIATYRGQSSRHDPTEPSLRRAPFLLFNATLEGNRSLGDEPELRDHIFTFSPVASGSGSTGYWLNGADPGNSLARRSYLDLGNIVATSGAFLSPGNVANPALSAILHLLNIQTGYWVHDPERFPGRGLRESVRFHLFQSLGVDREGDSRYMLTDGAHVENLGLYVLLQRRCALIVASDCSQEDRTDKAVRRFDALVHVLQQAAVDGIEVGPFLNSRAYDHWLRTGEEIQDEVTRPDCRVARSKGLDLVRPIDPAGDPAGGTKPSAAGGSGNPLSPAGEEAVAAGADLAREHYVFAQITYPDQSRGLLVYLRPTLTGDEGDGLLHGAADSRFPDDDPLDQFYTPSKMSTYRLLGRHIMNTLMSDSVMRAALDRIVQGRPPTDEPEHGAQGGGRADCDPGCTVGNHPLCLWNRQRTFWRSAAAGSADPASPPPGGREPFNGVGRLVGPRSSPPGRRQRRKRPAWARFRAFPGGPR